MWKVKRFNLKSKLLEYLSRGLCPKALALTITLAFILGIFPFYGVTTFLMLFVANRLRLNTAVMISTGYLFTPLIFVFWIPFIRLGQWLTFHGDPKVSLEGLKTAKEVGGFQVLTEFSELIFYGIIGWIWMFPIALGLIYFPLLFLLKRFQKKQTLLTWEQEGSPC